MPAPPDDAVRSPDGTSWWDGTAWQPVEAEIASIPEDAVRSPDGASWWDGTAWQPVKAGPAAAAVQVRYPARVEWQYGDLSATEDGVVFNMTTQTGVFRKKAGALRKVFPYADLDFITVDDRPGGAAITLRSRGQGEQPCQGCSDRNEVETFVEAVRQAGVAVEFAAADSSDAAGGARVQDHSPTRPQQAKVKKYKNEKEYERDANKMIRDGWSIEGQSQSHGKVRMGRTALKAVTVLPWAVMRPSRKGDPLTVTWVR